MSVYITLEQAKRHLNFETGYTDEDIYLQDTINDSIAIVEQDVNNTLSNICTANGGALPLPLVRAMLLMIGHLYANREAISMNGNAKEIPLAYTRLINFFKNYSN